MSTILHSIYGRKLGLDSSNRITVGTAKGVALPAIYLGASGSEVAMFGSTSVTAAASGTSGTTQAAAGITYLTSSDTTWEIAAPFAGAWKVISRNSSSTSTTATVSFGSASVLSSAGSTNHALTMTGASGALLVGISTATWQLVSFSPPSTSTPFVAVA
jgi:hypothetical protein